MGKSFLYHRAKLFCRLRNIMPVHCLNKSRIANWISWASLLLATVIAVLWGYSYIRDSNILYTDTACTAKSLMFARGEVVITWFNPAGLSRSEDSWSFHSGPADALAFMPAANVVLDFGHLHSVNTEGSGQLSYRYSLDVWCIPFWCLFAICAIALVANLWCSR